MTRPNFRPVVAVFNGRPVGEPRNTNRELTHAVVVIDIDISGYVNAQRALYASQRPKRIARYAHAVQQSDRRTRQGEITRGELAEFNRIVSLGEEGYLRELDEKFDKALTNEMLDWAPWVYSWHESEGLARRTLQSKAELHPFESFVIATVEDVKQ